MKKYEYLWKNKWLTADAETIDDMIDSLQNAADDLRAMKAKGVVLDADSDISGDFAVLLTTDPAVATEFSFDPEEDPEEEEEYEDEEPWTVDEAVVTDNESVNNPEKGEIHV